MSYNLKPYLRDQDYLLPPSLREWLPESDLAWFIPDAVVQMDMTEFYKGYRTDGKGASLYVPELMVGLLLYAYCWGQRSSRKIEMLCERDLGFRVVTGNARPDHATICRFRTDHKKALAKLFNEGLRLCREAGLIKVGVVGLDGTKMAGNASLAANRTADHIAAEVKRMLDEAEATDAAEDKLYGKDKRGDELPADLRRRESRLRRLRECKKRLDDAATAARQAQQEKLDQRAAEEATSGKKKRGRKPRDPEAVVDPDKQANVTDPESRIMKNAKGYVQGYNGQVVATEEQIVIAAELTQDENDQRQLQPMLATAQANLAAAGVTEQIAVAVADAGYWLDTLPPETKAGTELIVATQKDWKQRREQADQPAPRGRIPAGLSARERMERKLRTKRGRWLYRKRGIMPEPVFGQLKAGRGIRSFMQRGLAACASEWKLLWTTHNLLKLFRSGQAAWA